MDWVYILRGTLRVASLAKPKSSTATKAKSAELATWDCVCRLAELAEREDHYLLEFVPELSAQLLKVLSSGAERDQLLMPYACRLLRLVIVVPTYVPQIPDVELHEYFHFFSSLFKHQVLESKELRVQRAKAKSEDDLMATNPFLCAEILSALITNYAHDAPRFLKETVFPFFEAYFGSNPPDTTPTQVLVDGFKRVLEMNAMSVVSAFRKLCGPMLDFIATGWAKRSPLMKKQMVELLRVALRISEHLPPKKALTELATIPAALYTCLTKELFQESLYTSLEQTLDANDALRLDPTTVEFLSLCADLVRKALDFSPGFARMEPEAIKEEEEEDGAKRRKLNDGGGQRSTRKILDARSIWEIKDPSLPFLKFLYVLVDRHPDFLTGPGTAPQLVQLLGHLIFLVRERGLRREWALACLSRLARASPRAAPSGATSDVEAGSSLAFILIHASHNILTVSPTNRAFLTQI
jgi:hypothetical protein